MDVEIKTETISLVCKDLIVAATDNPGDATILINGKLLPMPIKRIDVTLDFENDPFMSVNLNVDPTILDKYKESPCLEFRKIPRKNKGKK